MMTVGILVQVGSAHKQTVKVQRERFVPASDDGSKFIPGAWQAEGAPQVIPAGCAQSFVLADNTESVKIWEEPAAE